MLQFNLTVSQATNHSEEDAAKYSVVLVFLFGRTEMPDAMHSYFQAAKLLDKNATEIIGLVSKKSIMNTEVDVI